MTAFLHIMTLPFLACLIFTGIHAYLGLHVIERQVIFVDLALAQIAAVGASVALVFGLSIDSPCIIYLCSIIILVLCQENFDIFSFLYLFFSI